MSLIGIILRVVGVILALAGLLYGDLINLFPGLPDGKGNLVFWIGLICYALASILGLVKSFQPKEPDFLEEELAQKEEEKKAK